jgi:hypothetical protein
MTTQGLGEVKLPSGEITAGFRSGWIRSIRIGLSSAAGATLILAIFQLLQRQPLEGFRLLDSWGPWPVVAIIALVLAVPFLSRIQETISTTFGAIVASSHQTAEAQAKTADALTRLAEQGSGQAQDVQRLAIYAAQEFPGVYERLDKQDRVLENHGNTLGEMAGLMRELAARGRHGD